MEGKEEVDGFTLSLRPLGPGRVRFSGCGATDLLASLPNVPRSRMYPLYDIWFLTVRDHYNPSRDSIQLMVDAATATAWFNVNPPLTKDEPSSEEAVDLFDRLAGLNHDLKRLAFSAVDGCEPPHE